MSMKEIKKINHFPPRHLRGVRPGSEVEVLEGRDPEVGRHLPLQSRGVLGRASFVVGVRAFGDPFVSIHRATQMAKKWKPERHKAGENLAASLTPPPWSLP